MNDTETVVIAVWLIWLGCALTVVTLFVLPLVIRPRK